jgi:hypothetical protein
MTKGERFLASLPLKTNFYDRYEKRSYLAAREVARRILNEPSLLEAGREYLERFMRSDPHQALHYELWNRLLRLPPEEIVWRLLEDSERGALLRDTYPVFVVLPQEARAELIEAARP